MEEICDVDNHIPAMRVRVLESGSAGPSKLGWFLGLYYGEQGPMAMVRVDGEGLTVRLFHPSMLIPE